MSNLKSLFGSAQETIKAAQSRVDDGISLPVSLIRYEEVEGKLLAVARNLLNDKEVRVELVKHEGQGKRGMPEIRQATRAGDVIIFENAYADRDDPDLFRSYYAQTPDNVTEQRNQTKSTQTIVGYGFAAKSMSGYDQVRVFEGRKFTGGQTINSSFVSVGDALQKEDHFGGAYAESAEEVKSYINAQWESGKDVMVRAMLREGEEVVKISFLANRSYRNVQDNEPYDRATSNEDLKKFLDTVVPILNDNDFKAGLQSNSAIVELMNMQRWSAGKSSALESNVKASHLGLATKGGFFSNKKNPEDPNDKIGTRVVTPMIVPGQNINNEGAENPLRYLHEGWNPVRKVNAKFLEIDEVPSPWYKPDNDKVIVRSLKEDGTYAVSGTPEKVSAPNQSQQSMQENQAQAHTATSTNNNQRQQSTAPTIEEASKADANQGPIQKTQETQQSAPDGDSWDDIDMDDIDLDNLLGDVNTNLSSKPGM